MKTGVLYRLNLVVLSVFAFIMVLAGPFGAQADNGTQEYEQVGAYSKLENAATMVESFRMEGKNAFIRQKTIGGMVFYAVIIDHSTPPPPVEPGAEPVIVLEPDPDAPGQPMEDAAPDTVPVEETLMEEDTMSADDADATAPMAMSATSGDDAGAVMPEPEPEPVIVEDTGPHRLIVPVTGPEKTQSIEIISDIELYDRPFSSAVPVGTYDELGGVFIKEYMGWYAIKLPDGRSVFIRMEDATPVSK